MKQKRKNVKFGDFIYTQPKQLTPQFCKHLIDVYETNPIAKKIREAGVVGYHAQSDLNVKQSEDINITDHEEFNLEDKTLSIALKKLTQNYLNKIQTFNYAYTQQLAPNYKDSGFQIQKTTPSGYYRWHHDALYNRVYTYIFYLNDVNHKGETQFANGLKVKPEEGKGLMFPATWEYVHRGIAPKNEIKYIVTGWMSTVDDEIALENKSNPEHHIHEHGST
tara:strand:+ start:1038 stop:1700 length:663 start_codon:yes stop_codon:yes gene_type:complete